MTYYCATRHLILYLLATVFLENIIDLLLEDHPNRAPTNAKPKETPAPIIIYPPSPGC